MMEYVGDIELAQLKVSTKGKLCAPFTQCRSLLKV